MRSLPIGPARRRALLAAAAGLLVVAGPSVALAGGASSVASAPTAAQRSSTTTNEHPAANIPASPDYVSDCLTQGFNSTQCISEVLAAIRHARSKESMKKPAMVLPDNYSRLSVPEQTFVVTNLERVDRGLRPFRGLTTFLNHVAAGAAAAHVDPYLARPALEQVKADTYASNWAGDLGPLASDYNWMYNDGYAKDPTQRVNTGCTSPKAVECWGHRLNILSTYYDLPMLVAGTGTAKPSGMSIAEVFTAGSRSAPHFVYTWKQALAHGAAGHRITAG